ncbi:MAG: DUF4249 domain-containing protein [Flavobacteriaceae bacterium]
MIDYNLWRIFHYVVKTVLVVMIGSMSSCIDPVAPDFAFTEGLVFVEGFAATTEGSSFVVINKSVSEFGVNKSVFVEGATVSFKNSNSGQTMELFEVSEAYIPPSDFKASIGERWELAITLADGTQYKSSPEKIVAPVPITNIAASYVTDLRFNNGNNRFEPGHSVSVTFNDPADTENYYYWSFRSFESLTICETCYQGIYRNEQCGSTEVATPEYFTYICETDCWKVRFPDTVTIYDDTFSNGKTTTDLKVAEIPLYSKKDILVEIQQYSLNPSAYEYYKVLKDIIDNSGGFNAPPPAALVGNMVNVNDANDFVFGRFTAAATSKASVLIERNTIPESALESETALSMEPTLMSPYPPPATTTAPCSETRFRTAIRPEGWIN